MQIQNAVQFDWMQFHTFWSGTAVCVLVVVKVILTQNIQMEANLDFLLHLSQGYLFINLRAVLEAMLTSGA